jgi:hypothetical protein
MATIWPPALRKASRRSGIGRPSRPSVKDAQPQVELAAAVHRAGAARAEGVAGELDGVKVGQAVLDPDR